MRILEQLRQLADAGFSLALLLLGCMVATVLLQVAFRSRLLDAGYDLSPPGPERWSSSAFRRS